MSNAFYHRSVSHSSNSFENRSQVRYANIYVVESACKAVANDGNLRSEDSISAAASRSSGSRDAISSSWDMRVVDVEQFTAAIARRDESNTGTATDNNATAATAFTTMTGTLVGIDHQF